MNGISSAANEENDSTERPARRRRSSILKPPRSPLQDLGDGNEITQGPNAFRSRKSSRRVSFADTIKVFETELHMKTEKKSENSETEGRENVIFIQNKSPEDNNCEITGMNTLLCAPIQTQVQRRKISSTEHNYERTHPSDQTAIFPDENKMDFTASHTVMITNGLLACTKSEKSSKIDTTSFLANLKLHTEDSRMKKEPMFSLGQNSTSERKINFNDFKKRLEAGKFNACSSTGPDKENLEIPVYYKDSNRGSAIHQKHVAFNADENNSNMTKILREQDDVMNFTQCHTVNIQTLVPTPSKAHLREFKGDDTTICGNDCMDLTTNHTVQILPSADNLSELENQTHVLMDIATDYGTNTQGIKIIFKDKLNTSFQDPSLNPKGTSETALYACGQEDMEVTRSHTTAIDCKTVTTNEIFRPMDKTVMFVDDRDELEMTKSHTIFIDYQALEKTELPGTLNSELSEKKSLKKSKVVSIPAEESVFFPENGEGGDHSTAKVSQLTLPGVGSDNDPGKKVAALVGDGNIEVFQSAVGKSSRDVQNPEFLSELSQSQRRKSLRFKNDKTIGSLKSDENDMDITKSCAVEINSSSDLEDKQDSHLLPLSVTSKTLLYTCGQDMELTRSHTAALQCETASIDKITIRPLDKTVMFVDNHNELQVTKSNTVFIDCQETEKLLYESTKLGITKSNTLSISFPTNSCSFKEMTNKQALDVEDKIIIHNKKNHRVLPFIPTNTLSKSQSEIEIKSHSNSVDKEVMGKVADQACTLEKAQLENYQLNRDNLLDISNLNSKQVSYNLEDPIIASNSGNISNIKPDLNNMDGKAKEFLDSQTVHVPPSSVLELISKANDTNIVQAAKVDTFNTESSKIKDDRAEENTTSCNEDANPIPLTAVVKDKMRRCSLGIFLPRLPNKKNVSVTGIDDLEQFPLDTTDLYHLETQPVSSKNTGTGFVVTKLDFSPSQYINEENLPIYPGEINSSDSISLELEEKALTETCQKEILPLENKMEETCNSQKRSWVPEEDDVQNEKKIRKSNTRVSDTAPDQISDHHTEGDTDKITNSALIKSLSRTPSSCSSSLDSLKADGTSLDCSTQHSSHMESQYLRDTICEDNLKEKLKDGKITLKEFLILLQVHILIQKPRQSSLPAKLTVNTPPTPEDMMLSQYVYRPKIQIYREDRDALHRKIEELNISALSQDKLLTDVNRDLWEKMRLYSDEELKAFGFYLNKIKSRFTKMTKVFTHQGKVTLYSKLVQSAQKEKEKLQMRINEMDNILQKIDKCLNDVEIETKSLEHEEKDSFMEEWGSEVKSAEKELEQLKTEEKELQRNLLELEVHKKQTLDQINLVRKQTNETEELLDQLSLSEWDIIEWNDDQAVFTFLYDTVELTMTFGEQVVGVPFLDKTFYRKIDNLNFQSLLDEDKAPLSTLLVHKLVFQYIMEQGSWKKKYTTQHQVPKMLQEISLVTSRCRLLGEEIEFLKRWGPNYNLMNIDVNNTELKLLFSSSAAFTKFEITLSLTANYPSVQLPLSIHIHLGDIGKDEITAVLSKVPQKDNYLKNVVKHIYQDLLQDCHFSP